ncbi:hypothetical protein KJ596_04490 [Patescibacteria group bacterium]|nr:hypothetical protein [Patescibacteria group bacterium]MBU1868032.1 hypothetical protein [Patescibacteria group bacterium]
MDQQVVGYLILHPDLEVAYVQDTSLGLMESWPLNPERFSHRCTGFGSTLEYVRSLSLPYQSVADGSDVRIAAIEFQGEMVQWSIRPAEMQARSRIPALLVISAVLVGGAAVNLVLGQVGLGMLFTLAALLCLAAGLLPDWLFWLSLSLRQV